MSAVLKAEVPVASTRDKSLDTVGLMKPATVEPRVSGCRARRCLPGAKRQLPACPRGLLAGRLVDHPDHAESQLMRWGPVATPEVFPLYGPSLIDRNRRFGATTFAPLFASAQRLRLIQQPPQRS